MSKENIERIIKDESFFGWHGYEPHEVQYTRYSDDNPSVIAAGHKITDVFHSFCNARASAYYSIAEDFGDLAGEGEMDRLYIRSHFLTNAILEYSLCLDMAWQVVWAYVQPSSFDYLIQQEYKKMEKECTRENLFAQLDCIISQGGIGVQQATKLKELLVNFDKEQCVYNLRKLYNSIKHHGCIRFEGLGISDNNMCMSVNGSTIKKLSRVIYKLDGIEELLETYHFKFEGFFNSIVHEIMPSDYCLNTIPFIDWLNIVIRMHAAQNK